MNYASGAMHMKHAENCHEKKIVSDVHVAEHHQNQVTAKLAGNY